jgi:hypothetical protein
MTLGQAVTLFKTRVNIDTDCDFDTNDNNACTTAIMEAAYRWSKDTYALFTWRSALTLTASATEYNVLDSTVSTQRIFAVYGLHINGNWVDEIRGSEFFDRYPLYYSDTGRATYINYTLTAPSIIKLPATPASAAINATDNFVIGFRYHTTYTFTSSSVELEGPPEMHQMIVDRCYLDSVKSYISADEAYQRRALIEADYQDKASKYRLFNLAHFKKEQRRAGAGRTRRLYGIGFNGRS